MRRECVEKWKRIFRVICKKKVAEKSHSIVRYSRECG